MRTTAISQAMGTSIRTRSTAPPTTTGTRTALTIIRTPPGVKGFLYGLLVPHTHDASDSIDDALEASTHGVRALKNSMFILLGTTLLQLLIFLISGSVALLADTIHNFADALTALPLWIAFVQGRRGASRRYTYGFGRAEDLAGLFIVAVVALSAIVAAVESISRFFHPETLHNLWWVVAAGFIGFAGNELVARLLPRTCVLVRR